MTTATHHYDAFGTVFDCRVLGPYTAGDPDEKLVEVVDAQHKWHGMEIAVQEQHLEKKSS